MEEKRQKEGLGIGLGFEGIKDKERKEGNKGIERKEGI